MPGRPVRRGEAPLPLEAALEGALLDAVCGEPRSPLLARRLETVARATLYRYGIQGARVSARLAAGGVEVDVILPPETPRVQQIRLRLG